MQFIDGIVCSALRDHISISPGGIVFLKSSVKRGILPQMLEEILNTRIMVKQSMKKHAKVSYYFKGWPLTVVGGDPQHQDHGQAVHEETCQGFLLL